MQHPASQLARCILAGFLAAAGLAYGALLVATYFKATPPGALGPDLRELDRLLFRVGRPVSPMQRRLEAADTPLGAGPLIGSSAAVEEGMRFAFKVRSDAASTPLTAAEIAEREGERQALLDWIRNGADRAAYEADDYPLRHFPPGLPLTPDFVVRAAGGRVFGPPRVRLRSLINERCVTCHHEDGDDTARLIPFDSYAAIARYLAPEDHGNGGRVWVVAALAALFPLAAVAGFAFVGTSQPPALRRRLMATTAAALALVAGCWSIGPPLAPVLLGAALVAAVVILLQIGAATAELLGLEHAPGTLVSQALRVVQKRPSQRSTA
jgi:hypothetical protein